MTQASDSTPTPSVLLLGASTPPGGVFLRHAIPVFREHYRGAKNVLIIVDASHPDERDKQARRVAAILDEAVGCEATWLHSLDDEEALRAVNSCDGVFAGGGQTFLLLRSLYERNLLEPLRDRIQEGIPYAGSSAGANIAGPVIGTTNDFPVTDIPTRVSLQVFPALINPHHPLADDGNHGSRAGKILWYLSFNPTEIVIGISEPGIVRQHKGRIQLVSGPAWVYRHGAEVQSFSPGADLTAALAPGHGHTLPKE